MLLIRCLARSVGASCAISFTSSAASPTAMARPARRISEYQGFIADSEAPVLRRENGYTPPARRHSRFVERRSVEECKNLNNGRRRRLLRLLSISEQF